MNRKWLLAALLVPVIAVAADTVVYRWVDANGVVHYSDQPHPGAVKVNLSAPQVVTFKTPAASSLPRTPQKAPAPASAPAYRIRILAPADGTTLRPAGNAVRVRVSVQPPLGPDAQLRYALDGQATGSPTSATEVVLQQVYRGTHVLTVTAIGANGEEDGSASSTFYVHQHSVLFRRGSGSGGG